MCTFAPRINEKKSSINQQKLQAMNIKQSNFLRMMKAVLTLCFGKREVWQNVAIVAAGVERVSDICSNIEAAAIYQQSSNPVGHTAAKEQQRTQLKDMVYRGVVCLRCLAVATKDELLRTIVSCSRSTLDLKKNSELLTYGRVVADACEANLPALAAYRVDEKFVATLRENIELSSQLYADRDVAVDRRMGATGRLSSLFNDGRKQLKALDDLVVAMIDDDMFVIEYTNARRIYDLRGRRAASSESKQEGAAE
jgi:hypothetical protein